MSLRIITQQKSERERERERGAVSNHFPWDEVDTEVQNYIFPRFGAERQRQLQQKRPRLDVQSSPTKKFDDVFITTRSIAFERYNFIGHKQRDFRTI